MKVLGKPAHLEGRGMSLTGPNIAIDRGANLLTMEGAGTMERFLDRDLENRPLSQPGTVRIDWKKGMTFDGRKAHFQDDGEGQRRIEIAGNRLDGRLFPASDQLLRCPAAGTAVGGKDRLR